MHKFQLLILLVLAAVTARGADEVGAHKNILVLYGERLDLPAIRQVEQTFQDQFGAVRSPAVGMFPEYFDFARFPADQSDTILAPYLRGRYAGKKIDLVITVTGMALDFALRHRDELFPGVPIVFMVMDPKDVDASHLPADVAGVAVHMDVAGTVGLALRLQPEAREIVVVSGASEFDKKCLVEVTPTLNSFANRIKWRAVAGRPLAETLDEVRHVPKENIVLVLTVISDGDGRALSVPEVARQLVPVSQAPIYGVTGTILGTGAVGGALIDFSGYARQTSDLALKILTGQHVDQGLQATDTPNAIMVDWRALKHWQLDESRLPAEATVIGRTPGLWETDRGWVIGVMAVVLTQLITIAGLLVQRAHRRRSQASPIDREKQISLVSQTVNLGLWVRNIETGEVLATDKFRALLNFAPGEALTYENFLGHLHPDDRETMSQAVQRAIAERTLYDTKYRVLLPDGSVRWIHSMGRAEYGRNGRPIRTLGVSTDITHHHHEEQEMKQLRHELAHVDRVTLLGQLASALAHELNQPLGAILRNAEAAELFLQMDPPDLEEVAAILADIRTDDQRAGQVIERMRLLLKRRDLESESVDVAGLIDVVVALTRGDAVARKITIETDHSRNLPPVRGDRVQFQQVLLNLVVNGMDALDDQTGGSRRVSLRAGRDGDGVIEIRVSDSGPGIPAEKLGKIFDPFFTTKPQGLGVGLAITRTIVEAHGGRIWAENNPEGGATFRVTLPVDGGKGAA